jgi:hypothetical protein
MVLIRDMLSLILKILLIASVFLSFWLFSRFTVDDAFISWRYGKNLVDAGVWNYNPAVFDMTQAYTSPIYAMLSIIPNAISIDVVLFFKLFSLLILGIFLYWFSRKVSWGLVPILFFLALPATFVHLFSGLETFLFVAVLTALLIKLYENRFVSSILLSLLLMTTRPEGWLLVLVVPLYFLISPLDQAIASDHTRVSWKNLTKIPWDWRKGVGSFFLLIIPLVLYFLFHQLQFGSILPNTFHIKSGHVFSLVRFVWLSLLISPILLLLMLTRKITLLVFVLCLLGGVIINYSTSALSMNYADRFFYHIFAPAFLFGIFLASQSRSNWDEISLQYLRDEKQVLAIRSRIPFFQNVLLVLLYALFGMKATNTSELLHLSQYYPRALDSHAVLGKTLRDIANDNQDIKSFSFGDAGMAAYHSELIALDNIGLGSSHIAKQGVDTDLLDAYSLDFVVFHSTPGGILNDYNQQTVLDWSKANGLDMVCEIYWREDYTLRVYARDEYPRIKKICKESTRNNVGGKEYFLKSVLTHPWNFWHE